MQPYRKEKLASTIQTFLSEAIRSRLSDPRIEPLTSITRVEVSPDLMAARVFVVVHGPPSAGRKTLAGLRHASGHLQTLLAGFLHIRQCPRISFDLDTAFVTAMETLRLIDLNRQERGEAEEPGVAAVEREAEIGGLSEEEGKPGDEEPDR
ncbi:MAG: 30S ribosome-binding factor RbfA [Phycisphaerales bacterium]|nr:30S ribosome-binding factor RbfA [Phycisphaerales bacterium]